MTKLEGIERDFARLWRAIAELSSADLAKLGVWLEAFEHRQLAEAIERDAKIRQERQAGQAGSRGTRRGTGRQGTGGRSQAGGSGGL